MISYVRRIVRSSYILQNDVKIQQAQAQISLKIPTDSKLGDPGATLHIPVRIRVCNSVFTITMAQYRTIPKQLLHTTNTTCQMCISVTINKVSQTQLILKHVLSLNILNVYNLKLGIIYDFVSWHEDVIEIPSTEALPRGIRQCCHPNANTNTCLQNTAEVVSLPIHFTSYRTVRRKLR